jgi:hypothetical protein
MKPVFSAALALFLAFAARGDEKSRLRAELVGTEETGVAGPTETSLTLSPSTIKGGSGDSSTGTVTLSAAAPSGGQAVTLTSSIPQLAASQLSVTVPAGATRTTFSIATNPKYRDYSGLSFAVTLSASANGSTQSATLTVTAQSRPPDIQNDTADRHGAVCGGRFPATTGERGILYNCVAGPNIGTAGTCSFQQECSDGCYGMPSNDFNFTFSDTCNGNPPFPLLFNPALVQGGSSTTGTVGISSPAPSPGATVTLFNGSNDASMPFNVTIPTGATQATFTATTMAVAANEFDPVGIEVSFNQASPLGQEALQWLPIVVPPTGPGPLPPPVVSSIVININPVVGGNNSTCSVTLSGNAPSGGTTVSMSSSNPAVAGVPSSVTVAAGTNTVAVVITTFPVTSQTVVTITATANGGSKGANLTVNPCTPTTCAAFGYNCGTASDSCGGTLSCGTCRKHKTCVTNVCQ